MFNNREQYLTEAAGLILDEILMPIVERKGFEYPRPTFRVSMGFPKHSRGGKAIAVCFHTDASTDGVNEIFINPEIDDPVRVMDSLVHELIHAIDNLKSGHQRFFAVIARAAGLEGRLTATVAGDALRNTLLGYSDLLGPFPHHRMVMDKGHKKAGTRMLKLECTDCGFICRTAAKWVEALPADPTCPVCESETVGNFGPAA